MKGSRSLPIGLAIGWCLFCLQARADDYTTPNTGVCWDLDSLVVYSGSVVTGSNQEFVFNGRVTISPLDTLVIDPGCTIRFADVLGDHQLSSTGRLFAQGTDIEPIVFTSLHQTPGDWNGISISNGFLMHCRVEYAHTGIRISSCAVVSNCTVVSNREGIRIAFFLTDPTVISDNLIADNGSAGIIWDGGLDRGQMTGAQDLPLIEGNQILDNSAAGIDFAWGTKALIRGNLISGHGVGISSGPYDESVVVENTITGNDLGVLCDYDMFPGRLNLGDLGNESVEDDGGNHIHDNVRFDLYNASAESVKAEGNHWGTTDPAIIDDHIYDDEEDIADADGNGIISGPVEFLPLGETGVRRSTWGQIKTRFK
jgi:hypothetical protein